jgi:hypothetical protein
MCHTALLDAKFDAFLLRIDEDLAAKTRARGWRRCGRRLHRDRIHANRAAGRVICVKRIGIA